MSTLNYENLEYNVVYIDPTLGSSGDGSTPATALTDLPATLENQTCYLMRRTNVEYHVDLKKTGDKGLTHIIFLGMPKSSDAIYTIVPEEAKTAWGSDTALYANMRCNEATYSGYSTDYKNRCLFYESKLSSLLVQGCYLYRDGDSGASNNNIHPMFGFNNYLTDAVFEDCKFSYTQYDLENDDFLANNENIATDTSKYPQNKCCYYLYANQINTVKINSCIINNTTPDTYADSYTKNEEYMGGSKYYLIFLFRYAKDFALTNCQINRLYRNNQSSNKYYPDIQGICVNNSLANGNEDQIFKSKYINNTINFIYNSDTSYLDNCTIKDASHFVTLENLNIQFKNMKNFKLSSAYSYSSKYAIVEFTGAKNYLRVKDLNLDATKNQNLPFPSIRTLWTAQYAIPTGNPEGCIENVNVKFCETNDYPNVIGVTPIVGFDTANNNYEVSGGGNTNYFSNNKSIPKCYIATNINVFAPSATGTALYLRGIGAKVDSVYGKVELDYAVLEANKIYNPLGIQAGVIVTNNSYLKCTDYEVNLDTYNGTPQVSLTKANANSLFIENSNCILFDENYNTNLYHRDYTTYWLCPNYITQGQYYGRNNSTFCKSWNITRVGSNSLASLKMWNNYTNGSWPYILGAEPTEGIHVMPSTTGKKFLVCYWAFRDFDPTQLPNVSRYCQVEALVPETVTKEITRNLEGETRTETYVTHASYLSDGNWLPDTSTWTDGEVVPMRVQIPIEVKELTTPINVKISYGWYDVHGYAYVDPDIKLIDIN